MAVLLPGIAQSGTNNGTVSPATPGSLNVTAGNALLLCVAVGGTNPTISTPAGWAPIGNRTGTAAITTAMFVQVNTVGGATNPSVTLGGTITGWIATMFEFNNMATNALLIGNSNFGNAASTNVPNLFSVGNAGNIAGTLLPYLYLLFVYVVARPTATITPNNTGINWSASQQPIAGVQGLSMDMYFATSTQEGIYPSVGGTFGASVPSVEIAGWLTTLNSSLTVFGASGQLYVGQSLNPAGSLQVPQPIGQGNFFSGTTGSF